MIRGHWRELLLRDCLCIQREDVCDRLILVLRREHIRAYREEAGKGHTAEEHHFMVRLPRTSLRGPWRTDTTLPAVQQRLDRRVL